MGSVKKPPFEDFPGGPVVKTLSSKEGDVGSFLVGELRSHIPCKQKTKTLKKKNMSNIVTNSIKTLKNGLHKKKKKIIVPPRKENI